MKERLILFWNDALQPRLKKAWVEFSAFISSVFFLKNFAAMIGTIALFLVLTFWWLKCYTHHGEYLQVHDYTNMPIQDAVKKAKSRSFRIAVIDSTWRKGVDANLVLEQDPKPFTKVKENRTIYIKVSKEDPDKVKLPNLVGTYDFRQYKRRLARKDINLIIEDSKFSPKYADSSIMHLIVDEKVIDQEDLEAGVEVPKGSTIGCVIYTRGARTANLPNIKCKRFSEVEFLLSTSGLRVGKIWTDNTVSDTASARVFKFNPGPGTYGTGTPIDLYLTQYPSIDCPDETLN
jgi:beta-lactam-binding protein with PASTA domain